MTAFLFMLACCTVGAFIIACTDVPTRRTFGHMLRSSFLLMGFVICGLPLMAMMFMPHPLAKPLSMLAFVNWGSLGALWSMRLDPGASLRPLPHWALKSWSLPDAVVLGVLGASTALLMFGSAS